MYESTLKLILALPGRAPAPVMPRALDALFDRLAASADATEASQVEELIWGVWMEHPDPAAEEALDEATRAIAAREHPTALAILDALVAEHPDYAEAWNKRATLHYLQKHDALSVRDIRRTLELEPRHFGAICGFGQICLRQGDRANALFAFGAALRINPHLGSVRATYDELLEDAGGSVRH